MISGVLSAVVLYGFWGSCSPGRQLATEERYTGQARCFMGTKGNLSARFVSTRGLIPEYRGFYPSVNLLPGLEKVCELKDWPATLVTKKLAVSHSGMNLRNPPCTCNKTQDKHPKRKYQSSTKRTTGNGSQCHVCFFVESGICFSEQRENVLLYLETKKKNISKLVS